VQLVVAFLTRTIKAIRFIATDTRIPRPVRVIAGVGLLPIPGPVDEVVLLLVAPVLFTFYRLPMREAWQRANGATGTRQGSGSSLPQEVEPADTCQRAP
jgi:hypothetical protein